MSATNLSDTKISDITLSTAIETWNKFVIKFIKFICLTIIFVILLNIIAPLIHIKSILAFLSLGKLTTAQILFAPLIYWIVKDL